MLYFFFARRWTDMAMTIAVRRGNAADADLLSSLNADVQAIHAAALPWRFKAPGLQTFPPAAAAAVLARADSLVFIAEVDSDPAGYAYVYIIRWPESATTHRYEALYLHHISVRPAHRRRGCGRALLAAVRAAGADMGIGLITLDVWTFNDEARAFFAREGFAPYNERLWNR